jgi:IS5 family transposase
MSGKISPELQQNLFKTRLREFINMGHPLVRLAQEISWDKIELKFCGMFSDQGRPSIAIRKIAGMLLLKEIFKESDESVVERWIENAYWQYFTGEDFFQTSQPFDPSQFVHFRKRIGTEGLEFLLSQSVSLHPRAKKEKEVQVDTTVQEKNITFPTDSKLAKKVIDHCSIIAEREGIAQRQSYKRVSKKLLREAYFGHHPKRKKKAVMARKKLRTIGKRLVRELERKLPENNKEKYKETFDIYWKALTQEQSTKNKVYSLHEPQVSCIAKGKSGKAYEFGAKVAVVRGRKTGVITAVRSFCGNPNDSKTLQESLDQSERVRKSLGGTRPKIASVDRGFRGVKEEDGTKILVPNSKKAKTRYEQQVARLRFRARAAIEPSISHLKRTHSLGLNFLKGTIGDINNALLAGIGYNIKLRYNQIKQQILFWLEMMLNLLIPIWNRCILIRTF